MTEGLLAGIFVMLVCFMFIYPPTQGPDHTRMKSWAASVEDTCGTGGGVQTYTQAQYYDVFTCQDGSGPYFLDWDGVVTDSR